MDTLIYVITYNKTPVGAAYTMKDAQQRVHGIINTTKSDRWQVQTSLGLPHSSWFDGVRTFIQIWPICLTGSPLEALADQAE